MTLFLSDIEKEKSYEELIRDINESKGYCRVFKSGGLYDFFLNFLVGLVAGKQLVLLDSDLSKDEIGKLNIDGINVSETLLQNDFKDFNAVIDKIQNSASEIIIFTSGTTGQPKQILHSVSSLARAVQKKQNFTNTVWGFAHNPTHMAGLQVFFQAFMNKHPLINLFKKERTGIYNAISKYQITHISATPTFYRLLLPFERSYPSVIRLTFGGEKSDKKLHENMLGIFPNAKINNIYASTEGGSLLVSKGEYFQIPEHLKEKIIVANNELWIHQSLLGNSAEINLDHEYYHTSDLVEWVDETTGTFRFHGRKNELINIGGFKVNPAEVEEALSGKPGIKHAIVYSKPNSVLGNILCADVQLYSGINISEIEIRKYLSEKLQDYKVPRKITFVENISLTRTGKIKRS
ncbi:MAG TPA: fatty acid--CoA ligase family protein [Bacteroidales bacterium]|nr:fatty acid--CoA ligase family protein [Bacteroidales bacterium]HPS17649.1 fatty acid--CoA ligase family protein [Bacteroidales bacterium]